MPSNELYYKTTESSMGHAVVYVDENDGRVFSKIQLSPKTTSGGGVEVLHMELPAGTNTHDAIAALALKAFERLLRCERREDRGQETNQSPTQA